MTPEERTYPAHLLSENLEREIAAHLASPAFLRELVESHICGGTYACRGADADGVARCHEAEEGTA